MIHHYYILRVYSYFYSHGWLMWGYALSIFNDERFVLITAISTSLWAAAWMKNINIHFTLYIYINIYIYTRAATNDYFYFD